MIAKLLLGACISACAVLAESSCKSVNFHLVAEPVSTDLSPSINGWAVSSYHIGPCYDLAILDQNTTYADAFYLAGSKKHDNTTVFTDGATPVTPYGLVIAKEVETDEGTRRPTELNCGDGTTGVHITTTGLTGRANDMKPHLALRADPGTWYACKTNLPYGAAVALYYRSTEQELPAGCVDVWLETRCTPKVSAVAEGAHEGRCEDS